MHSVKNGHSSEGIRASCRDDKNVEAWGFCRLRGEDGNLETVRQKIPVGVLFSTSGPYASLGREGFEGAMSAIAEINAAGKFDFELQVEARDPQGNTESYARFCREIVKSSGANFIVGCTTSWSRKEVIPVLEKTGAHLWYPCPYEGFESNDHVVYIGACPNQHIVPLLNFIVPRYGANPALVGSNYIWGWETCRIAREQVERAGGHVAAERFIPLGDTDINHLIAEVRAKRPDFIINTLIGPSSTAFVAAYHALGQKDAAFLPENCPIVSCNWTEGEVGALGAKAAGHYSIAPYFQALDSAENRAFLKKTERLSDGQHVSAFFVQAYTAIHMIARGISETGRAEAVDVLAHATANDFASPFGPVRIDAQTNHAILIPHIGRAVGAGFEVVSSARVPIIPDPYLARPANGYDEAWARPAAEKARHLRVIK